MLRTTAAFREMAAMDDHLFKLLKGTSYVAALGCVLASDYTAGNLTFLTPSFF